MLVSGKPVEMLAVLVVLTLLPTWSDGLLLTKCELKSQLQATFSKLQEEIPESIIAKLACTVEQISGFNSSLFNIANPLQHDNDEDGSSGMGESPLPSSVSNSGSVDYMHGTPNEGNAFSTPNKDYFSPGEDGVQPEQMVSQDDGQARKRRDAPSSNEENGSGETQENLAETNVGDNVQTTVPEGLPDPTYVYDTHEMISGPSDLPPQTNESPETGEHIYYDTDEMLSGQKTWYTTGPPETKTRSKRSSGDQTKLYGIFQLSDTACNSGSSQSPNLCGLDCSALTDDDIADDIACLVTLNKTEMSMAFTQGCESVDPSQYFAGCG